MARAEGEPASWRAADGRDSDDRAIPAAGDASAAAQAMARASSSTCAKRPAARRARRFIAASSTASCSPCPSPAATSTHAVVRRPACSSPSRAARRRGDASVEADAIDENRLLLLEDGHCLKDHALSACNRPELRAHAAMMGTSLHTLVQMVDNGLGLTFVPGMAIEAGILDGTNVDARPLRSEHRLPPDRVDLAPLEPPRERVPAARDDTAADRRRPDPRTDACGAARWSRPAAGRARYSRQCGLRDSDRFAALLTSARGRSGRRSSPWSTP